MKVLVCGSRKYADRWHVYEVLDAAHAANPISLIIHGGATGADALAHDWAEERGIKFARYRAEWKRLGNAAGPIRNQLMLDRERPDFVIQFPGGNGTADMVRKADAAKVPVFKVEPLTKAQ